MREAPEKVRESLERLKKAYGSYLELRYLNKRFCVFEATSKWDPEAGKPRKITHYLGWITDDGLMVPARHRKRPESAKELEEKYLERISSIEAEKESATATAATVAEGQRIEESDRLLLKALSMNSRLSHQKLSKITGIKASSVPYRIKRLESAFGIKYTVELDLTKLGFWNYMIFVRFTSRKPSADELKAALEGNEAVQLAMLTKGGYDLVIFCVAENSMNLTTILNTIRENPALFGIVSEWYVTPATPSYGFIPFRDSFFNILKERVWHRKKGGKGPSSSELMLREYAVMLELNADSTVSFARIDEKYDLPRGSAKSAYEKLRAEGVGVIVRPTISMNGLSIKYNAMIFADVQNYEEFKKVQNDHRRYVTDEPDGVTNRFTYMCDTETPDSLLDIMPVLREGDLDRVLKELGSVIRGVRFHSLVVSNVIVGGFCYRKFDNLYGMPYLNLVKQKAIKALERNDYY